MLEAGRDFSVDAAAALARPTRVTLSAWCFSSRGPWRRLHPNIAIISQVTRGWMLLPGPNKANLERSRWRVLLVVLAICGLTISLTTRTFHFTIPHQIAAKSESEQAVRQHLDRDGATWIPPVLTFAVLQVSSFYPRVAPAGPPLPTVLFEKSLYNRPPPSC